MLRVESQIDREYLSEISGGDTEFECELLSTFVEASPALIADFRSALAMDNAHAATHAAHTLKGSSRSIGGNAFAEVCETAEVAARNGDLDTCRSLVVQIETAYQALAQACEMYSREAA